MNVVVSSWNRSAADKSATTTAGGALPLTKTNSSSNSATASMASTTTATVLWQTNLSLILGRQNPSLRLTTSRLCIQAFDVVPDYSTLLDALTSAGFGRHQWTDITRIEIRDCSGLRRSFPPPLPPPDSVIGSPTLATAAVGSTASSRSSSSSSLAVALAASTMSPKSRSNGSAAAIVKLSTQISKHAPNVVAITSDPWECSPDSRCLGSHLASTLLCQLHVCSVPLLTPIARPNTPPTSIPPVCSNLASLSIQTSILRSSASRIIPVLQLHTLKLLQAEAFFSWEAFATSTTTTNTTPPSLLEFANLTSLTIDFEKDHVANDSHRYDAQKGGKSPRVTMGVDKRRVLFPKLTNLCIRKLPYTYPEAWAMFLDSPIKNLALAGKFAHIRYLDTRVLRQLNVFDMHVYLSEKSFGKFTAFVKTVLSVASTVKSGWIRHSEIFPISVPQVCGWSQLQELNITAYIPTFTLLALVSQLPVLHRLIAQRIARDDSEAKLESPEGVYHVEPGVVASTSVRDLQLHMGGSRPRVTTLQNIIYIVLCMPRLRRLSVKHAYWSSIRSFIQQHGADYPELLKLDYASHIYMTAIPAQLL
ncbi:hypothetical protein GGF42_004694 [Coemansia sp. RSA 2424]|nr:hypothetical protein GGF42_004694 [Coemansia sp. RSA 2424]